MTKSTKLINSPLTALLCTLSAIRVPVGKYLARSGTLRGVASFVATPESCDLAAVAGAVTVCRAHNAATLCVKSPTINLISMNCLVNSATPILELVAISSFAGGGR